MAGGIAFFDSFLVLKSQLIVSNLFTHKMSVAHCGKWRRLILAGSPNLACLPRGLRASVSSHMRSLLRTYQRACLSSSDFAALPSYSVNRVFAVPSARVFSPLLPLSVLKKWDTLRRPLPPVAVILAVDCPLGRSLLVRPLYRMLPSFHVPP